MIPPKTVQDILDTARIEEVIGDFINLRRRGVNLIGLCPFHNERTPSFNVNPPRNVFKCFGCGKAGDSVTFLREHENFSFEESLRWLAKKYNIEIQETERTPEQVAEYQMSESLYILNDFAQKHFQTQLFDTDEGQSVAMAYFRKRGLREDTIRTFGLGYAPEQRDLLVRRINAEGHQIELAKELGLCSQDGARDFFRGRVMFTIHNISGKIAAFAGRSMTTDKTVPKYINSPESSVYIKNKTLFGLYQAKGAIRKHDECILVEGYMDVISMYQAGIQHVVASSGTSLTEGQLQLIKRNTQNLKILYDGDAAGIKAALRGLDLALAQDLNVKIVLLPDGHDPDSYVQQFGLEAMQEYLDKESKDFILFKTNLLVAETKGDPIKKAGLVKDILGSIALIPDPIKRSLYLRECSALLGMEEQTLVSETNKLITTDLKKRAEKVARSGGAASDSGHSTAHLPGIDPGWPGAEPYDSGFPTSSESAFPTDPGFGLPAKKPSVKTGDEFQERDIIRLLVQFGDKNLPDGTSLAAYLLSDIEESIGSFDNQLYARVATICRDRLLAGEIINQDYFLRHESKEFSELAIDLLTEPWEYSPNWIAMKNLPLQNQVMPELNFDNDMRQALDHFKLRKLIRMCDINMQRIKTAEAEGDEDAQRRYLQVQMKLYQTRQIVTARTGTVIIK